jgi:DNA-binding protein Fis
MCQFVSGSSQELQVLSVSHIYEFVVSNVEQMVLEMVGVRSTIL